MSVPSPNLTMHVTSALNARRRGLESLKDHHGHLSPAQHEELSDLRAALKAMEDPRVAERIRTSYLTS